MVSVTREGLPSAGVGRAPAARWTARPDSGTVSSGESSAIPRLRRSKATRCCHCDFCRPPGGAGEVRLCISPGRADGYVIGDQWACGQYQPAVQEGKVSVAP